MRKLASIRQIKNIAPIANADAIELATVDGWEVVIKKDQFKIGDKVVYFEIDSFLPIKPEFEFLRKSSYKKMGDEEGFRLRTIKLRGQISQGLLIPVPEQYKNEPIGTDLTEALGVQKFEPPIPACLDGVIKGYMPSFIKKTDEERIQNLDDKFEIFKELNFHVSEKLEGTSFTVYLKDGVFGVCGRNLEYLEDDNNSYWKVAKQLDLENKLRSLGRNLAFQGEMIGEGIQKNSYKIKGQTVKFFNIYDIDAASYLEKNEFLDIIDQLALDHVPVIEKDLDFSQFENIQNVLKYAEGHSKLYKTQREGVIFVANENGKRYSFKVISNKYLAKHG